jgi:SNF2 family DNA or RNA helicase
MWLSTLPGASDSNRRPAKRQRKSKTLVKPSLAALALLERVAAIRGASIELRDDHQHLIDDFDRRSVAKRAAAKAAAKVTPAKPAPDVQVFTQGDAIRQDAVRPAPPPQRLIAVAPPLPAMSLLVEPEPPEKVMVEQSVIWRAHMINRRNAELARERLPKQPEAQRGKTHWDYVLDEAVWLANDFREERKWKMQMAKKVSKMVLQFHAQHAQRGERARRDEQVRRIRLANSVARDVRKFWNQIREIADYRQSVIKEAELAAEREDQLNFLLLQTEKYTNVLATNLHNSLPAEAVAVVAGADSDCKADLDTPAERSTPDLLTGRVTRNMAMTRQSRPKAEIGNDDSNLRERTRRQFENGSSSTARKDEDLEFVDDDNEQDDEATMAAAEAEEEGDPEEIEGLHVDAELSVEDLLRRQGIDPSAYLDDAGSYAESISGESSSVESESSADEIGEEAQAEEAVPDVDEAQESESKELSNRDVDREVAAEDCSVENTPRCDSSPSQSKVAADASVGVTLRGKLSSPRPVLSLESAVDAYRQGGEPDAEGRDVNELIIARDHVATHTLTSQTLQPSDLMTLAKDTVQPAQETAPSEPPVTEKISSTAPSTLLRGTLRDYQRDGMEWLATMYDQKLNGILADEMGLGKTIQTISLLAWLAIERGIWGPHLVVVPTSVMINWEVEFKKWLPGFKVLSYYGTMKERRMKRQGWSKANAFHVCITSYNLVVQDASALRRKKWVYLILDEAHNIKNFQSQRWQTLLNFPSRRRLLLTGTPLQNSVMELWSLMHFLMPNVFASHADFKDWFSKPLNSMVTNGEQSEDTPPTGVVANLHRVLRPFLLRRLKADVEKSLPGKFEHIVSCPLSKRQRQLYEDFMARSDVKETLNSGDFIGVMNVLMQLRKVCNHPDLFEGRPIVSPFSLCPVFYPVPKLCVDVLESANRVDLALLGLDLASEELRGWPGSWYVKQCSELSATEDIREALEQVKDDDFVSSMLPGGMVTLTVSAAAREASRRAAVARRATLRRNALLSELRTRRNGMLGADVIAAATMTPNRIVQFIGAHRDGVWDACPAPLKEVVWELKDVATRASAVSENFVCVIRPAVAPASEMRYVGDDRQYRVEQEMAKALALESSSFRMLFRSYDVRSRVTLPDARLVQWDCGKLQVLDNLIRELKQNGHRVLIFTQMTKVLDVLESFLNLHAHRYLRLDGSTKTEERQKLVERFNNDTRVFCMILTTRAGGLGLNLTGADTVVFYDTDYNPSMDAQAQDRAHRIGQTKPVHIYRLVSEKTVEENILRRAQQKRSLESLVISKAGFTTDAFRKTLDVIALVTPDARFHATASANDPLATDPLGSVVPDRSASALPGNSDVVLEPNAQDALKVGSDSVRDRDDRDSDDMDAVGSALFAGEDEREALAAVARRREEMEAQAEFEEKVPGPSDAANAVASQDPGNAGNGPDVVAALTPLQIFALRFVEADVVAESSADCEREQGDVPETIDDERGRVRPPDWQKDFSLEEMLRRHEQNVSSPEFFCLNERQAEEDDVDDDDDETDDDCTDGLVYELDTTDAGQGAYLKVLTDTDADIKVYLPLRDGDPEELKKSAVVNGTAAAGLECAEDAAFFPHAYNRMSRTPYATRRQKEKAAANLKRRRLEESKAKTAREKEEEADVMREAALTAAAVASVPAVTLAEKLKAANKAKGHVTAATSKASSGIVSTIKRGPGASGSRRANQGGTGGQSAGASAGDNCASGLFTKSTKKAKGGLNFHGRAAVGVGVQVTKEEIGLNDRWTLPEERYMLELVTIHNKNMTLVADALAMSPHVVAGHRMSRGHKRCIDRMKTLTRDVKNAPPSSRAVASDEDSMQEHSKALAAAALVINAQPPPWARAMTGGESVPHPSHASVVQQAVAKGAERFPTSPPTLAAVAKLVTVPEYHCAGMKPADCTPAAIARRRRPFMRPRGVNDRKPSTSPETQRQGSSSSVAGDIAGTVTRAHPPITGSGAAIAAIAGRGAGSSLPTPAAGLNFGARAPTLSAACPVTARGVPGLPMSGTAAPPKARSNPKLLGAAAIADADSLQASQGVNARTPVGSGHSQRKITSLQHTNTGSLGSTESSALQQGHLPPNVASFPRASLKESDAVLTRAPVAPARPNLIVGASTAIQGVAPSGEVPATSLAASTGLIDVGVSGIGSVQKHAGLNVSGSSGSGQVASSTALAGLSAISAAVPVPQSATFPVVSTSTAPVPLLPATCATPGTVRPHPPPPAQPPAPHPAPQPPPLPLPVAAPLPPTTHLHRVVSSQGNVAPTPHATLAVSSSRATPAAPVPITASTAAPTRTTLPAPSVPAPSSGSEEAS